MPTFLSEFSYATIAFILLLAFLPALGWLFLYRELDYRDPEPLKAIAVSVLFGMLCTAPVFALQYFFSTFPDYNLVSFLHSTFSSTLLFSIVFLLFVALVEEAVKAVAFILAAGRYEKVFNQVVDGIVYAAAIGVGFAISENIYYFVRAYNDFAYSVDFFAVFAIRSLGTMLAHTLFAGVFGFYFARAYFAPFIDEESKSESFWRTIHRNVKHAVKLHATFFHLLPAARREKLSFSIKRNVMILEGFFLAIFLHFLYNFLIKVELFGQHWTFLIVPALFLKSWYLWGKFFTKVYIKIIDFIQYRRGLYKVKIH